MPEILTGKPVAEAIFNDLKKRIESLAAHDIIPAVAILRVGNSESDISYEKGILKRAASLGIRADVRVFDQSVLASELIHVIGQLNQDAETHGIMLFRPLTGSLKPFEQTIVNAISPEKDIDGATEISLGKVLLNDPAGFYPCTAEACVALMDYYGIPITGKNTVVIGRSPVVGKPLSLMLTARNATVTLCHTKTADLQAVASKADILITAAGKAGLVDTECVHSGQRVIDVSVNFDTATGTMTGDVTREARALVTAITPVPGGVGTVTSMILMTHIVRAAENSLLY